MTAKKPAGKAKSAVSGKFITKAAAKANPRETFIEGDGHKKCVRLSKKDLCWLTRTFDWYAAVLHHTEAPKKVRILAELDRAISAHKGKV